MIKIVDGDKTVLIGFCYSTFISTFILGNALGFGNQLSFLHFSLVGATLPLYNSLAPILSRGCRGFFFLF